MSHERIIFFLLTVTCIQETEKYVNLIRIQCKTNANLIQIQCKTNPNSKQIWFEFNGELIR